MKDHDYERADEEDRLHFIQCSVCGKWFDVRDLAEVMEHQEHEPPGPQSPAPFEAAGT